MSATCPSRPRLADHVQARGHWVDGAFSVILHDAERGGVLAIGAREWAILLAADGTRDLAGVRRAADRDGVRADAASIAAFFERLAAHGLVDDDAAEDARPAPSASSGLRDTAARPILAMPDFTLRCDGRGACCRNYTTVLFSSLESARARALLPDVLDAGARAELAFFPERGGDARRGLAVVQVDGACAYLASNGRCSIHAVAGEAAKPLGCRTFPAQFIDDGEHLRVGPSVECACILASAAGELARASSLLDPSLARRGDLDPAIHVTDLGPVHVACEGRVETLEALRAWTTVLEGAPPPRDAAAAAWALAAAIREHGLDPDHARAALRDPPPIDAIAIVPALVALAIRATEKAEEDATWRSSKDLARASCALLAASCGDLLDGGLGAALAPPEDPTREAFALRATAFAHGFATSPPIDAALEDFAVRLVAARAVGARLARAPHHESLREPIAVVWALVRAHGVASYRLRIAEP
jgi:lysine-N-methylase